MAGHALASTEAPLHDSIRISAAVLVKGETGEAPGFSGEWVRPPKGLPTSIALYLRPSGVIDSRHGSVMKAAYGAQRLLGPSAGRQVLDDPRLLAAAVKAWVELNLEAPDEGLQTRPYASDPRLAFSRASLLIQRGMAGPEGKVRVRLAMLRALGVPARAAWLRGRPAVQYWAHWLKDEVDKPKAVKAPAKSKSKAVATPKGEWVLDETTFAGESAEAWSLDAGDLASAFWRPEQELAMQADPERAYFSLSETPRAMAALDYVKKNGRIPPELAGRVLAPRKGTWLMLANHRAHFHTQGSLEALYPIDLLLAYRPKLASWGSQDRPRPDSLETVATGFWTDRPDRVRVKKNGEWFDEYQSPPPAYGVLHYASFRLRKPSSAIEARVEGAAIVGKLLRRDSLSGRPNAELKLEFLGEEAAGPKSTQSDAKGNFSIELDKGDMKGGWVKVSGGLGAFNVSTWDSLLLELPATPD